MRVYFTTQNNGDGSSSVMFFDSQECIDYLEDIDPEGYGGGEGGGSFDITGKIIGIEIRTMKDVLKYGEDCL